MRKLATAALAACIPFVAPASDAAVLFAFEETGGNLVGSFSGSLDLTAAEKRGSRSVGDPFGFVGPELGAVYSFGAGGFVDSYLISGPGSLGTGAIASTTNVEGSNLGIFGIANELFLPDGYVTGDVLLGSATFHTTLAALGIVSGDYVFSLPNDTVTLRFTEGPGGPVNPIPIPATLPLLIGALGLAGVFFRRRTA